VGEAGGHFWSVVIGCLGQRRADLGGLGYLDGPAMGRVLASLWVIVAVAYVALRRADVAVRVPLRFLLGNLRNVHLFRDERTLDGRSVRSEEREFCKRRGAGGARWQPQKAANCALSVASCWPGNVRTQ
jgi:hypothetical protein